MARAAAVNNLAEGITIEGGGVSAGASSATLSADPGSNWPTGSGVFSAFVYDETNGHEVINCTRTTTALTLSSDTFDYLHPAGTPITYIASKDDWNNKASLDAANTFTLAQLFPVGSAAAPGIGIGTTDYGWSKSGVSVLGSTAGTERIRFNSSGLAVTGSITPTGVINNGLGQLVAGSQSLSLGTSPGELEIATASSIDLYLPSVIWGRTTTPVYIIKDPQNLLTALNIYPLAGSDFFTGNDHNSINEGFGSEGAWIDAFGSTGPAGSGVTLTAAGCTWRLSVMRNDPGVAGGAGGWNLNKIASGGYT